MAIMALGMGYNGSNPEVLEKIKSEVERKIVSTKKSGDFIVCKCP